MRNTYSSSIRQLLLACSLSGAVAAGAADSGVLEKGGQVFYREAQNAPDAELRIESIPGRLLWLRNDTGVERDAAGKVTAWKDAGGSGAAAAQTKPERLPDGNGVATAAGPSVRFVGKDPHEAMLLVSGSLPLDPKAGVTIATIMKVENDASMSQLLSLGPFSFWSRQNFYTTELSLASCKDGGGWRGGVGQWQTVVGVWDPATGTARLYRNGEAAGSGKLDPSAATNGVFAMGAREGDGRFPTRMDLAEVVCFNRALDDRERVAVERVLSVRHGLGKKISTLAAMLPYAYYPSLNKLEVAIQVSPELRRQALGETPAADARLTEVKVRVVALGSQKVVAERTVALDALGQAQELLDLPDLPDGEYAVEYAVGKATQRSAKTFKRIHFPWEGNTLGEGHTVLPPFTPVEVKGKTVSIVQRSYTVNGFGLFDSVISQGRELLAAPMRIRVTDAAGKEIQWRGAKVTGRKLFDDQAVFECEMTSKPVVVKSRVTVGEDGCAKVEWTLSPGEQPETIASLTLEIPVKDEEAPLFHFVGDNSMRFNFAGATPKGGKIVWDLNKKGWFPITWKAEPGTESRVLWDSRQTQIFGNPESADWRPFTPYVWLGAEERGLAWFGESERGWSVDGRQPCQSLAREKGALLMRAHIIQLPTVIREPRIIAFGLMASPGKPKEPDNSWRARPVASGIGAVVCWGGWLCSSKYPDNHDWSIVDKIQEIGRRGNYTQDDEAWLMTKAAEVKKRWPDRAMYDNPKGYSWFEMTKMFAVFQGRVPPPPRGMYFEEHATDTRIPEWEVFQDEWASVEFNRFQKHPANWGVFSPSYQDFALYMANEWMKRGVSLYFDNSSPKRCYNPRFSGAWRSDDGVLRFCTTIFEQREYYRRVYKLLQEWNRSGKAPHRLDFTLHITNTQTIPMNTWSTALLDLEQSAEPASDGAQLPWRPDYTRTVTMGRQAGSIPIGLDTIRGFNRHTFYTNTPHVVLGNWGMARVHEVRNWASWPKSYQELAAKYEEVLFKFGYGTPEVAVHNYWNEKSPIACDNDRVKWIYLEKKNADGPTGLLLVQNYDRVAQIARIKLPKAAVLVDIETKESLRTSGRWRPAVTLPLASDYGTRMFLVDLGGRTGVKDIAFTTNRLVREHCQNNK